MWCFEPEPSNLAYLASSAVQGFCCPRSCRACLFFRPVADLMLHCRNGRRCSTNCPNRMTQVVLCEANGSRIWHILSSGWDWDNEAGARRGGFPRPAKACRCRARLSFHLKSWALRCTFNFLMSSRFLAVPAGQPHEPMPTPA